jgi:hypothetical protein
MVATEIDNLVTRSSGRSTSTSLPGPSTSTESQPSPIAEIIEPPADPILTDLPQDIFTLPVDTELQDLLASSERRFPAGTSLDERLRFLVDLHLQVCDLDYAQLPDYVLSLNSNNFLSLFSTARQQNLASLVEAALSVLPEVQPTIQLDPIGVLSAVLDDPTMIIPVIPLPAVRHVSNAFDRTLKALNQDPSSLEAHARLLLFIIRLRSSIAVQAVPIVTQALAPPTSRSGMYKRLNSLKSYPIITTGDVFWLDLQRHADANGLTTLQERLAHFHQAIVTDRPLMTWFENTIKPRILTISLEELCTSLVFYPNPVTSSCAPPSIRSIRLSLQDQP